MNLGHKIQGSSSKIENDKGRHVGKIIEGWWNLIQKILLSFKI